MKYGLVAAVILLAVMSATCRLHKNVNVANRSFTFNMTGHFAIPGRGDTNGAPNERNVFYWASPTREENLG